MSTVWNHTTPQNPLSPANTCHDVQANANRGNVRTA